MNSDIPSRKNILPVKYPPITSYNGITNSLCIAYNYTESLPWFFSNFIQLYCNEKGCVIHHVKVNFLDVGFQKCPFINFLKLDRKFVDLKWSSFIDFIVEAIDMGYYITMYLDWFYIPVSGRYNKKHMPHPTLIYGYNKDDKTALAADFYKNGVFSFEKISFTDIEQAYKSLIFNNALSDRVNAIHLFSYKNIRYEFDVFRVKSSIEDYITCKDSTNAFYWNSSINADNIKNYFYGLDVYKHLIQCLEAHNIDIRSFHVLCDHKAAMLLRLQYMQDNGYLNNFTEIYDSYKEISRLALVYRNLLIKYKLTGNPTDIKELISGYSLLKTEEEKVLEKVLCSIVNK